MNIALWLYDAARQYPDNPALFCGDRLHADYRSFAARAAGLSRWLLEVGVRPGDRVALFIRVARKTSPFRGCRKRAFCMVLLVIAFA